MKALKNYARVAMLQEITASDESWASELGITLSEKQKSELLKIKNSEHVRYSIVLDKGEGKSFLTAFFASRWLVTHTQGMVVVLCPTMRQSQKIWIPQFADIVSRSKRAQKIFQVGKSSFGVFGCSCADWGGFAPPPSRYEHLQGMCRENLLIIQDESRGIPEMTRLVARSLLSREPGKHLLLETGL